jgi:predicted nucleotidyltransferase
MTIDQYHNLFKFQNLIKSKEYDFLRTDPHLGNRIMFLTLGGSHAYGTNTESSDVDIRGCTMNNASEIVGLSTFEQFVETNTDTTVYAFNKLITLLMNCNPNTIEMLGCRPEHYIYMTDAGQELIDNRKLFLSKRALYSFGGYANQQLNRLENALARDALSQAKKEEHIRRSMENSVRSFEDRYSDFDAGSIKLYTDISQREDMDREIFADIHLEHFPARQFNSMLNDIHNVIGTYEKLNHRNHKKDDAHLNKHAMHLVRLYLMCIDILEKEEVITYREADHDLLMSIRNGNYQNADHTYKPEFFEIVDNLKKRLDYAKENTSLPAHPNMKQVEEFVMSVNRRALSV